jgi:ribosomal protein L22
MKPMKGYTIPITKEMVTAQTDLRASTKAALSVCRRLNRHGFANAIEFAEKLTKKEVSIDGKYHDKTAKGILRMLKGLEANAKNRDMDAAKMRLNISVHNGPKLMRGRRNRHHGMRLKNTFVQAVLIPLAEKKKEENKR